MAKSASPNRIYEDYDPPSDLVTEEGSDTILIYLPGYRKEQLRVQLPTSRILKISGERPIGNRKYKRFTKEFGVPSNCDTKNITAKFEGGILYIRQPKLITPQAPSPLPQPPQQEVPPPPPQPQPRQEVPPTPQPQPRQEVPPPQPQPRQEASPPQPQPQQHAPLPEPPKAPVEEKVDGGKDQCVWTPRPKQVGTRKGLFDELRRPENFKRLAVCVIVVLSLGFYIKYMHKSFMGDEKDL